MNPNSRHQVWSLWTWTVMPGARRAIPFAQVRENLKKFGRREFGSVSQMNVKYQASGHWIVKVRSEGHPVHDPRLVEIMKGRWLAFFTLGFGVGTTVELETKLEAGSRDDGTPAEQLVILPPFRLTGENDHA